MKPLDRITGVYLLHFDGAVCDHARHYMGWALDIAASVERHRSGTGARLVRAAKLQGLTFTVARIWPGLDSAAGLRALKRRKNHRQLCPICKGETKL